MLKGLALGTRGNRMVLVLGLILGLLAAALAAVYLSSAQEEGSGGVTPNTVPAVVAVQDIAAGTRITAEMVKVKSVPTDLVIPNRFGKSEDVVGKVAAVNIVSGEEIATNRVIETSQSGQAVEASSLAEAVPLAKDPATCAVDKCGQRAVSVNVAPATASGGQIQPGDHVDVILAFEDSGAITILQDIEVLSIDQELVKVVAAGEGEKRTQVAEGKENPEATTATLAVWPEEAQILTAGEEFTKGTSMKLTPSTAAALGLPQDSEFECKGSVRLVLRHEGQQGPVDLRARGVCASLFAYTWGLK